MYKIHLILFAYIINSSLILMLNSSYVDNEIKSNEYFLDTCCSLDKNEKIYLSCLKNEIIRLNLIEIYYNSNEYCSSEYNCCKFRTNCSRRITKYSSLHCDDKNSCWINKSCLKIYEPCASIYGLYGQYITINYSCLKLNNTINTTTITNNNIPFILKFLISDDGLIATTKKTILFDKNLKSSPLLLISISFIFVFSMLIMYYLTDQFGKKVFHSNYSKNIILQEKNIFIENKIQEKDKVQSQSQLESHSQTQTRTPIQSQSQSQSQLDNDNLINIKQIYPSKTTCQCNHIYSNRIHQNKTHYIYYSKYPFYKYINIQHQPINRQFYYPYLNRHYTQ